MRLFVAAWPSPAAIADLAAAVDALPPGPAGLRRLDPTRWHLTLAFLGDVDDAALAHLEPRLARVAGRSRPGEAALAGAGRFGSAVVWVGVSGATSLLAQLAERSVAAARHAGVAVEDHPFRAHLTVARGRPGVDTRPWVRALADYTGPTWPIDRITLVRSHLGSPTTYEVLDSWSLASARPE